MSLDNFRKTGELDEQINVSTESQFKQKQEKVTPWLPPAVSKADLNLSYPDFINSTYEELRGSFPSLITCTEIIKDTSGNYPIYLYVFNPEKYKETITITAGIHGDEPEGYWGLFYILNEIYRNPVKHKGLMDVRNNVRIALVPVVNPWGYENFTRANSNGVNVNRNFDVNIGLPAAKAEGSEPFSENEAKAVKILLNEFGEYSKFHLDIHTVPLRYNEAGTYGAYSYVKSYSRLWKPMHEIQEYIVDYWNREYCKNLSSLYQNSDTANITNYAQEVHEIPAATLEFASGNFGELADASEMRRAIEWYGNVLLHLALSEIILQRHHRC